MRRTSTAVACLLVLTIGSMSAALSVVAEDPPARDPDLVKGIADVDNGDYDTAIPRLEAAARRLTGQEGRRDDLVQAYVHLAIASLAKGFEATAKSRFRDALALDPSLRLSSEKFSPRVIEAFEKAREQVIPSPVPTGVPVLHETFAGLTPGTNQFFDLTLKAPGRLQITVDWGIPGRDIDVYLATPACTNTSAYPPDVCKVLARGESPTTKPEVLRAPVTPGNYRIVVWWCGDPECGTGTEAGTVHAVLQSP
jgi:hypothetical protein